MEEIAKLGTSPEWVSIDLVLEQGVAARKRTSGLSNEGIDDT